jgi:hypothetical protein
MLRELAQEEATQPKGTSAPHKYTFHYIPVAEESRDKIGGLEK